MASRGVEDHDLDRPAAQARQRVQPTGTNSPCGLHGFLFRGSSAHTRTECGAPRQRRPARVAASIWSPAGSGRALKTSPRLVTPPFPGAHGGVEIPVPIPNTEVKGPIGESTAGVARGRVARRRVSPSGPSPQGLGPPFLRPVCRDTGFPECRNAGFPGCRVSGIPETRESVPHVRENAHNLRNAFANSLAAS